MIEILLAATFYYLVSYPPGAFSEPKIHSRFIILSECEQTRDDIQQIHAARRYHCIGAVSPNLLTLESLDKSRETEEEQKKKEVERKMLERLIDLLVEVHNLLKKETLGSKTP
jgi:hypothetical protein